MTIITTGRRLLPTLLIALGVLSAGHAKAQVTPGIAVDLNLVQPSDSGGCEMTFVISNSSDVSLSVIRYQLGLFDTAGRASDLVNFRFEDIMAGRTLISTFILGDLDCADITRVLLNRAEECSTPDGTQVDLCDPHRVATQSTSEIMFGT